MTDQQERVAEIVYGAMSYLREEKAGGWIPGGNSLAQDHARQAAHKIIAAMPAPTVQEWQPIETAPKDGADILLAGEDWVSLGGWKGSVPKGWWRDHVCSADYQIAECHPTHWMPLPALPLAEQEGE
jgi:hypothetical protein